jgi:hypothetical protein
MARNKDNLFTTGTSGAVGKQIVYKEINGKSFMCKYPDMSQVKYNKKQIGYQTLFSQAVEYARSIMSDPQKKMEYARKIHDDKRKRGTGVYHAAIKDFMAQHSQKTPKGKVEITFQKYRQAYNLTDRMAKAIKYLISQHKLTNALYRQLNKVSRITATRDLQLLVQQGIIIAPELKGAGAIYSLAPLPGAEQ